MQYLVKLTHNTCVGYRWDIVFFVSKYPDGRVTDGIQRETGIPATSLRRELANCVALKIFEKESVPNQSGSRGRNTNRYRMDYIFPQRMGEVFPQIERIKMIFVIGLVVGILTTIFIVLPIMNTLLSQEYMNDIDYYEDHYD